MAAFALRRSGPLAEIIFDDGRMNLLSASALRELDALLPQLGEASVIVLRSGREALFAAGADMAAMAGFDGFAAHDFAVLGQQLFERIARLPALTIAVIDGDCYGGALDLALAFDLRWATPRSRFAHPGSRIGIVTGFGGTSRLPHLDTRVARRLLLENAIVAAGEAERIGLVDRLIEEPQELSHMLEQMAANLTPELLVAKTLLRTSPRLSLAQLALLGRRTEQLLQGTVFDGHA